MKKLIVILALALALPAANAFAISTTSANAPTVKGFNPTNGVTTAWIGNATNNAWAAASSHSSGDKEYWTSSAFGGIAFKEKPASGVTATGAPATPTDSTVATGYQTM